jgi:hypothetical protein
MKLSTKYHKILSLFKRDMEGDKKFIIGEWTTPELEYLKDNKWVFTEKVDGTNIRVMWDGKDVVFGGRSDDAQLPVYLIYKLDEHFKTMSQRLKLKEIFPPEEDLDVVLYGEGYGAKIQKGGGNYIPDGVDFVLFDVLILDRQYDKMNLCPIHSNNQNVTQKKNTMQKDCVNCVITEKDLYQRREKESTQEFIDPTQQIKKNYIKETKNGICERNLDLASKNMMSYQKSKEDFVKFVVKSKQGKAEMEKYRHLLLTTTTKQEKLEGYCVVPAIQQSIKQNEISNGSKKQSCTCSQVNGIWLERENVKDIAEKLGIKIVPIIGGGTLQDAIEMTKKGFKSQWGDFIAEGIVARPKVEMRTRRGDRIITKVKYRDFN